MTTCMKSFHVRNNLFADEEDENRDPNYDVSMSSSPDVNEKVPFSPFLEDEQNKEDAASKTNTFYNIDTSIKKPQNLIQKWNRGDIIFKGKYSSGVTPKFERPVLKIKSRGSKRKRSDVDEADMDSGSQERRSNPFLEITPQMKRKVRKCSFQDNNGDLNLDFSSPPRTKKLACETPAPCKSFGRIQKMIEEATPMKSKQSDLDYYEKF